MQAGHTLQVETSSFYEMDKFICFLTHESNQNFRAEKRSAQASAHPLSQAQGGLFLCVDRAVAGVS